jgi:ribosome-binding factor A
MAGFRKERVETLIREKIGTMIARGRIKDPRVNSFITITRVQVSKDLVWADVYVSVFDSGVAIDTAEEDGGARKRHAAPEVARGLESAAGFIQAELAREMRLRVTPKLRFHLDKGLEEEFEMIQKIDSLVGGPSV